MENEQVDTATHETARLERLRVRLAPSKAALLNHPLYGEIDGLAALRLFMEHHVFAVWDFMSLLKALQARLCCVGVPWLPAADPQATRFVNEIVLAEESDDDGQGGFASHFALYRRAMVRCGADPTSIDGLLAELRRGSKAGLDGGEHGPMRSGSLPPCAATTRPDGRKRKSRRRTRWRPAGTCGTAYTPH